MKARYSIGVLVFGFCVGVVRADSEWVVHEWGTFTSIVGSDGRMLSGLEVEEGAVPNFVHSFTGFAPYNKGWNRPVAGVTVKMETPVLYFYSAEPRAVRVEVSFNGGSISQWYPERQAGETLPPAPKSFVDGKPVGAPAPLDFAAGYRGSATWQVNVLARDAADAKPTPHPFETAQWPRARVPQANFVRSENGETEGFIFYRGIGRFALPLLAKATSESTVLLRNSGTAGLPFIWAYGRDPNGQIASWFGSLSPRMETTATLTPQGFENDRAQFFAALVAAGLTGGEANALIATWRESYFERPGLRIFWIVPRTLTDEILPLTLTPRPTRLERVLVGRTELLTPGFETQLLRDFASDGGQRWESDRYMRAYRERVQRMGGIVGVAPAPRTP